MAPTATGKRPKYHVTLSDGTNTVGLMAVSGGKPSTAAIRRFPRGPGVERKSIRQVSWHGGRGALRFSDDQTRYADGRAWTMVPGYAISAPLWSLATGYRTVQQFMAGQANSNVNWTILAGAETYQATKITPTASWQTVAQRLWVRKVGSPTGSLRVALRNDNSGQPGTEITGVTLAPSVFDDTLARFYQVSLTHNLVSGTPIWITVSDTAPPAYPGPDTPPNCWQVLRSPSTGTRYTSTDGSTWASGLGGMFYRLEDAGTALEDVHFFEYKRQLYAAVKPQDQTANGALYMNGDRGVATGAQGVNTLKDTTKAWTTNEWQNCTVLIIRGTNKGRYARIASNTADTLTLTDAFPVACATGASGSEYVILGSDKWTALSVGLGAGGVSSVAVMGGVVYLAQGLGTNMRRMREYNNAGTWTRDHAADGTNKADFIVTHQIGGSRYLYRAQNEGPVWSRAPAATGGWGTDLVFESDKPVGDTEGNVTAMVVYDDKVYITQEDRIGLISDAGNWAAVNVPIGTARDERNGRRAKGWNTYLYFPFLDGLERLYGSIVDDIGPNRDEGMPANRRGRIADFCPVFGRAFAALDGDTDNYSAILATNSPGGDWHELYRTGMVGRPVRGLYYQSIPGRLARLWFQEGPDLGWLYMPRDAHTPLADTEMLYAPESHIVSAWHDLDSPSLDHFYDELRAFTRNLSNNAVWIAADYQVDNDSGWTVFTGADVRPTNTFVTSPYQAATIGAGSVTGRRWRYRLRLYLHGVLTTPVVINAIDLRAVQMNEVLYDFMVDFGTESRLMLMSGEDERTTLAQMLAILEGWKEDASPLTWRCVVSTFDNLRGQIDALPLVPRNWDGVGYEMVGSLTFKQI